MAMITQRQQIITTMKMQMGSVKIVFMMRNYQMRDSTGNNIDLSLYESFEVETDSSVENKVDTNVARKQKNDKKTLFGLSSSNSSESSEETHGGDVGKDLQRIINCFPAHKKVSEEPHVVACVNAAGDDCKQRSTEVTQATLKSVRVKEDTPIYKDVLVPNTE
eukprot:15361792-Ditylum_brightwellii.AAC.1